MLYKKVELSKEEEENLIKQYLETKDKKYLAPVLESLYIMIKTQVHDFLNHNKFGYEFPLLAEDLIQEAYLYALGVFNSFDFSLNYRFSTYFCGLTLNRFLWNNINKYHLRDKRDFRKTESLNCFVFGEETEDNDSIEYVELFSNPEIIPNPDELVDYECMLDKLNEFFNITNYSCNRVAESQLLERPLKELKMSNTLKNYYMNRFRIYFKRFLGEEYERA